VQVTASLRAAGRLAVTPITLDGVLTVAMAAARAGCSATVVQRAIQRGQLAATRIGHQLFIEAAELDRWVAGRNARR
jgi:excisionase family DNA binding protein